MAVLTKIINGGGICNKAVYSPEFGGFSTLKVGQSTYYLFTPLQAVALQKIGVELEFYHAGGHIYAGLPPHKGIKPEKADISPYAHDTEALDKLVAKLNRRLRPRNA